MKRVLKKLLPRRILKFYQKVNMYDFRINMLEKQMRNQWLLEHAPEADQINMIWRNEFKIYSQTGEDGIINYIFSRVGVKNKKFVEIGVEDGRECNTANLSMNFGWKGMLVEADSDYARKAKEYYAGKPVKVVQSFVTRENVNALLEENGFRGEIDLLSIDIDGNDYWVWEAINAVNPRVVIVEYNSILGKEARTIKYNPRFERLKSHSSGFYYGASLAALAELAEKKGYILVGCNSFGFNAFFVKKDAAKKKFKNISPEYADPVPNGSELSRKRFDIIKNMPFEIIK